MFIKLKLPINLATIYVEIPTTKNKKFKPINLAYVFVSTLSIFGFEECSFQIHQTDKLLVLV